MITIITPTYNRAYIIEKAYESLCQQTDWRFEWIVVDDGSTDETETLVKQWIGRTNRFSIRYVKQKNGGKHRAVNKGVALAAYEYILILDSDDYLTCDACEKIHRWIGTIEGLSGFAGVAGLKGWSNREGIIGLKNKKEFIDATNLERTRYKLTGDKAEVYKTELMRQYPFPEFEGENFIRESVVWDKIAQEGYKIRWFNEVIYKGEYLEDGLTKNVDYKVHVRNFNGYIYATKLYLETHILPYRILRIGHCYAVVREKNLSIEDMCSLLGIGKIGAYFAVWICTIKNRLQGR